jgi:hypothetical protein
MSTTPWVEPFWAGWSQAMVGSSTVACPERRGGGLLLSLQRRLLPPGLDPLRDPAGAAALGSLLVADVALVDLDALLSELTRDPSALGYRLHAEADALAGHDPLGHGHFLLT